MSPLRLVVLGLYIITAVTAVTLARRDPRHKPVAWYLAAVLSLDVLRLGFSQLLPLGPAERQGTALLLRHLDQGAYLGLILAPSAMAMALFLRRRPWPVLVAHVVFWAMVVLSYPVLRGFKLLELYSAAELSGGLASVGMFAMWTRQRAEATVSIKSGTVLAFARLAVVLVPALVGEGALANWLAIVGLHGVALAVVLALQLRVLLSDGSRQET